jgi:hypothetical protein
MEENVLSENLNPEKENIIPEQAETKEIEDLNSLLRDKIVSQKTSFYTELMVTAGPRKNFEDNADEGDFDLGEDSTGCFVKNDTAYFWLLDGTSDRPVLKDTLGKELFSSRLLAQELGWHIQESIWGNTFDSFNSRVILENAFNNIRENWQKRFSNLSGEDKESILLKIDKFTQIDISTTVILGSLSLDGKLDVSYVGDSIVITTPGFPLKENRGRFFVIISKNEEGNFLISNNPFEDTRCERVELKEVNNVILASDGISKNTIAWLNTRKPDFRDPSFRKTISAIRQGTCDDKALCIIQILTDD